MYGLSTGFLLSSFGRSAGAPPRYGGTLPGVDHGGGPWTGCNGGTLPGGTLPGGTLLDGTLPGGTLPGGDAGVLPGC